MEKTAKLIEILKEKYGGWDIEIEKKLERGKRFLYVDFRLHEGNFKIDVITNTYNNNSLVFMLFPNGHSTESHFWDKAEAAIWEDIFDNLDFWLHETLELSIAV